MAIKRIRVFAGPNGSGKTTILKSLKSEIPFGIYINADDIEAHLKITKVLFFNDFQLNVNQTDIQIFFKGSEFAPIKRKDLELWRKIKVERNVLYIDTFIDSYLAADLADFIRQQLLVNEISFTYETVLSHKSKLDFLQKAKENGYRIYLYYIATEDPEINISRVNVRVSQNGHFVLPEIIRNRYYKSLQNLKSAVKSSNRAYIWDNSSTGSLLISEITNGEEVEVFDIEKVPNWFVKYLINNGEEN